MMKDNDLKRNASGYYDETPYKAITSPPLPGEIWTHTMHSDYVLILNSNEKFSVVLKLDEKHREGKIPVQIRAKKTSLVMYTDPMKVSYYFHDLLGAYKWTMADVDFAEVRKKVAKAMGLKVIALTGEKPSKLSALADVTVQAPSAETFQIQEYHLPIYHAICLEVERRLFSDSEDR